MPLTGTGAALGQAIKTAIHSLSDEDKKDPDKVFEAMGNAIINHIISNGTAAVAAHSAGGVANLV